MKPRERKIIFTWEERKRNERARYYHLWEDTKRVCARAKEEEDKRERERERGRADERKKDNQERAMRGEENKRKLVCAWEQRKIREIFFSHETYIKIIVIDLIIVKLFKTCSVIFFPRRRRTFSRKYFYSCMWLLLIMIVVDNIILGPGYTRYSFLIRLHVVLHW